MSDEDCNFLQILEFLNAGDSNYFQPQFDHHTDEQMRFILSAVPDHSPSLHVQSMRSPMLEDIGIKRSWEDAAKDQSKHIPRPRNAFIIYRSEKCALAKFELEVAGKHSGQPQVTKRIAEMWKNESEHVKAVYKGKFEQEKKLHKITFPGYKYTPIQKRLPKTRPPRIK